MQIIRNVKQLARGLICHESNTGSSLADRAGGHVKTLMHLSCLAQNKHLFIKTTHLEKEQGESGKRYADMYAQYMETRGEKQVLQERVSLMPSEGSATKGEIGL